MKRAFTLIELLVVIGIIAILASLAAVGYVAAINQAREARTRSVVGKIDTYIMEQWESYRTRPVPARPAAGLTTQSAAVYRLNALRELQRVELPERISDLCTDSELAELGTSQQLTAIDHTTARLAVLSALPAKAKGMKRLAARSIANGKAWTTDHQGAECLYLILATTNDGTGKSPLAFFTPDEIGDVDGDGMKEILDGFGKPIEFLRWTPGYTKEQLAATDQTEDFAAAPDPFDPLKVDGADQTFAIRPLIFSAGPDGQYDIAILTNQGAGAAFAYVNTVPPNDPYHVPGSGAPRSATPFDTNNNGLEEWADNITNHWRPLP